MPKISYDENGLAPLHVASLAGDMHATKELLLECLADIRDIAEYATPLMHAVRGGNIEIIDLLIDSGADVNAINDRGEFPLQMAVFESATMTKALLLHGADPNQVIDNQEWQGATPLIAVCSMAPNADRMEIAETLIEHGANVNAIDNSKRSPLLAAAMMDNKALIRLLAKHWADPNIADANGLLSHDIAKALHDTVMEIHLSSASMGVAMKTKLAEKKDIEIAAPPPRHGRGMGL